MQLQEIELPISQIEIDPDNVRSGYDADIVSGLRRALETSREFINPPTVYEISPGRYRVKHGNTRVLAAKEVAKSIRVRVVEPPSSEGTKILAQMSENLLQGSLRPADVGQALKRLRSADGRERSISQLLGALKAGGIERNKTWVVMHLALAELAPAVRQFVNSGELAPQVAYALRSLSEAEQVTWAHKIVDEGLTREDVRRQLGLGAAEGGESIWREIDEEVAEAASRLDGMGRTAAGTAPDPERRNSAVTTRRELLPIVIDGPDARRVRQLSAAEWTKRATEIERQLAQEAMFVGGYSARQAIELVDRASREAQDAGELVMSALNVLRRLIEHPAELARDSALTEFMALRMRRVLENVGRL